MIDSHCHLADSVFEADAAAVVARARDAGLAGALCILDLGDPEEHQRAEALAGQWPALDFSMGVHPHHAAAWADRLDEMETSLDRLVAGRSRARAVGEIGLNYHYDFAPRAAQRDVFARQAAFALERDLPVVIHAREADDDTLAVVREVGGGRLRGVLHCFTGGLGFAEQALALGLHVSLAGIVTFPKALALHEVARFIPDDRVLVETDSPFLAPVPHRGKRNEPAWVRQVAARLADLRGQSWQRIAEITTANYERLFWKSTTSIAERC
ncbi:MAG: TatD family hydrolase [Vicinamibacterales bacterium]